MSSVKATRNSMRYDFLIAASTMATSCSVVPPLTPTPAMTWPSLVSGTPPPIAEYRPPETVRRGRGRAWLHEGDEVSGAHADEGGRVGLSLGEFEGERGRSGHAVGEHDVAVDVDDANRDGYVLFERLGLDAVSDVLGGGEQVHGRALPSGE